MNKFFWIFALVFSVASTLFTTGCDDDDDDNEDPKARVMVIHASPDAPGVDVLVDDTKVNSTPLTFPNNSAYLDVMPGVRNVKVNVAGSNPVVTALNFNTPNLEAGKSYSAFAGNAVANIEPILFSDDLTVPAQGKAHVRFIHLSPDAPAVDIAVAGGGAVVFSNVAFKESSTFSPLDAGSYNLEVRVAGTQTVALTLPAITLEAGKIYTVFAKGFLAGTDAQALGAQIIVNN
ncbi:MAG: DUF4397 domain-containing protein [Sphingobacteriales bacterium]|nr:MAG: DUF4397 domain-containing protein [Sphingobacteriales bacterium]